jgi:hypothetical protein
MSKLHSVEWDGNAIMNPTLLEAESKEKFKEATKNRNQENQDSKRYYLQTNGNQPCKAVRWFMG